MFLMYSLPALAGVDGGGGFVSYQADKLAKVAKAAVIKRIENVALPQFAAHPERRTQAILGIKNLDLEPTQTAARRGRALMFDYDAPNSKIIVLAPFFDRYASVSDADIKNPKSEAREFTETYMTREVAHFWNNGSDDDSDEFAAMVASSVTLQEQSDLKGIISEAVEILDRPMDQAEYIKLDDIDEKLTGFPFSLKTENWTLAPQKKLEQIKDKTLLVIASYGDSQIAVHSGESLKSLGSNL